MVTLIAPAGTTRNRLLHDIATRFEAGSNCEVLHVPLDSLDDSAHLPERILQACDIADNLHMSARDQADAWLRNRNVLLVLDDADVLAPGIELELLLGTHRTSTR
jgi:hypothetical protein